MTSDESSPWRCHEDSERLLYPNFAYEWANSGLAEPTTAACARLVGEDGVPFDFGYFTLADVCLEYQRHFPDGIRCMDENWQEL